MTDRLLKPEEIEALPLGEQGEHRKPTIGSWWKGNCELFDVIKKAQDAKTLREVGEWLDTKWVSYGTFAFIKLSDEEMKALKQGKFPEGTKD